MQLQRIFFTNSGHFFFNFTSILQSSLPHSKEKVIDTDAQNKALQVIVRLLRREFQIHKTAHEVY